MLILLSCNTIYAQKSGKAVVLWQQSIDTKKYQGTTFFDVDKNGNSYLLNRGYYDSIYTIIRFDKTGKREFDDSIYFKDLTDFKCDNNDILLVQPRTISRFSSDFKHKLWAFSDSATVNYSICRGRNSLWVMGIYTATPQLAGKNVNDLREYSPLLVYNLSNEGKLNNSCLLDIEGSVQEIYCVEDSMENILVDVNTVILKGPDHHDINLYYIKKGSLPAWSKRFMGGGELTHLWVNSIVADRGYYIMSGNSDDTINFESNARPDTTFQRNASFVFRMKYDSEWYDFAGLEQTSTEDFSSYPSLMIAPYSNHKVVVVNDKSILLESDDGRLLGKYDFNSGDYGDLSKIKFSEPDETLYLFFSAGEYYAYKMNILKIKLQ